MSHPDFRAEIDENHVDEYIYYKYNSHDRTLFKGVRQIPPGYFMEVSLTGEKLVKYWDINLLVNDYPNKNEAIKQLDQVFKSSVQSQLISDVKVGCQLSGGIDSSLVTTYARQFFDANMDTFSVIPQNKNYSEEKYIDQVIEKTNSESHKLDLTADYFARNLISAAWHIDVPLPIPQAVGIKRLAEGASDYVTVLLSGEGSDELMGGYQQIYSHAFKIQNHRLINWLSKIPVKGKKIHKQFLPHISDEDYFIQFRSMVNTDYFKTFRPNAKLNNIFQQRKHLFPENDDLLKSTRYYEMKGWLVNLLNIQDKMTMAHSIENRVPILDKKMIDFVFSLPSEYFIRSSRNPLKYNSPNYYTKILLKKLTTLYYNKEFVYRTKMGFNQPTHDYFSNPLLKEMINDMLLPGIKNRGIMDYNKIRNIWVGGLEKRDQSGLVLLWSCFSFELWAQLFIDKKIMV